MPLRLSFETGNLAGVNLITGAKTVRIGRDPQQSDLVLSAPGVSRRHAILERSARGGYTIEIVGNGPSSLNGDAIVAIAGRPPAQMLSRGDRVDIGGVEFKVTEAEVRVICTAGPAVGRELLLGGPATIGSGGDCDLVIAAPDVVEKHIEIAATPLGFRAYAAAPTAFNGKPAQTRLLSDGDDIVIGTTTLRVSVALVNTEADSAPAAAG